MQKKNGTNTEIKNYTATQQDASAAANAKQNGRDALALIVILAFVAGVTIFFTHHVRAINEEQNIEFLRDEAVQSEKYLTNLFLSSRLSIRGMSLLYEQQMTSPQFDWHDLKKLEEHTLFDHILFVNKDGICFDSSGDEKNIADREYVQKGLRGEFEDKTHVDVYGVFQNRFNNETSFLFFTPLYYQGEIVGLFIGAYGEDWLTNILARSSFEEESVSYICLKDGTVVGSSRDQKVMPNILDYYRNTNKVSEEEFSSLLDCFSGKGNSQLIYDVNNETEIAFAILSERKVWVLVQKYPRSVTQKMSSHYNRVLFLTDFFCVGAFVIFILYILMREMRRRNRIKATSELAIRKKSSDLEDTLAVLPKYYYKVIKINLAADTYEIIKIVDKDDLAILPEETSAWIEEVAETGFIHKDDIAAYLDFYKPEEFIKKFAKGESRVSCRYRRETPDGFRWVKMEVMPGLEFSEENPIAVLYVLDIDDDVMREKALQESYAAAEKANKAKSEFLSNMSHEIRTPMNAIIGMTAIAELHVKEPDFILDYLKRLSGVSSHLMDLINEVLDMSKIESGKIDLHDDEFSISSLIDNIVSMSRSLLDAKHHEFSITEKQIEHENVIGDSHRLQQALMNFLSNAIKYTPEGGNIKFAVTEKPTNKDKVGCFEFVIEDNGIGMTEEYQKHLFEPFTRANDTRVNNIQGTGLGMPITLNIVQMMNGNINVQSELNKGTKFIVTIFLKLPKDQSGVHTLGKKNFSLVEFEKEDFSGKKVLLVDDNELNREITTEILKLANLEVEPACNGKEAVEKFQAAEKGHFSMIFMDVQMPIMNGYEATRTIRALSPDEHDAQIPIIALTANAFSDDVVNAMNAGANGHIAKPLNFEILLNTLKQWLAPSAQGTGVSKKV